MLNRVYDAIQQNSCVREKRRKLIVFQMSGLLDPIYLWPKIYLNGDPLVAIIPNTSDIQSTESLKSTTD